jgi:hypothetical protein
MEHLTMKLMSVPGAAKLSAMIPAGTNTQYLAEQHRRFYGLADGEALCLAIEYHIRLSAVAGDFLSPALRYLETTIDAGAPAWERPR